MARCHLSPADGSFVARGFACDTVKKKRWIRDYEVKRYSRPRGFSIGYRYYQTHTKRARRHDTQRARKYELVRN
eukprot:scaffold43752_cov51-Attheya_sp.AAC.2